MQLHELPGDGEAEPRSMVRSRRRCIHLRELAEYELVVISRYTAPGVANFDDELL
jgi:hypothetical protein